jgi:hypothetical protein
MNVLDWLLIALVVVIALAFGIHAYLKHNNPAAAVVSTDAAAAWHAIAAELGKLRTTIEAKVVPATPAPAEEPAPVTPGKAGQAGTFTAQVSGDPKVDIPAITAQYYG